MNNLKSFIKQNEVKLIIIIYCVMAMICYFIGVLDGAKNTKKEINTVVVTTKPEFIFIEKTTIVEDVPSTTYKTIPKVKPQSINLDFDILTKSGYSKEDLTLSLSSSSSHKGLIPYIDAFIKAEEQYGVNALYLMCQLGLESGWGKYTTGKNNIAGWTNGRGGYRNFDSVESCIMYVASKLSTFYKNEVGTKLGNVCAMYCPNDGYATDVMRIMKEREKVINSR